MAATERPLGHIETLMALMHAHAGGTTQCSGMVTLVGPPLEFAAFTRAVAAVLQRHPALRGRIEPRGAGFVLLACEGSGHIEVARAPAWAAGNPLAYFTGETNRTLDPAQSLCRFGLLVGRHEQHIVFVCHHAIIDASGFHEVLDDLLAALDGAPEARSAASGDAPAHDLPPADEGLPPPVDELLLPPLPLPPQQSPAAAAPVAYAAWAPLSARATALLGWSLAPARLQAFQQRCNDARLKPHSVISAALAQAAHACGVATDPASVKTAVSLRELRLAAKAADPARLGCHIAVADTPLALAGRSLREVALDYEQQLLAQVLQRGARRQTFDAATLGEAVHALRDSHHFRHGFAVTNLGQIRLGERCAHLRVGGYVAAAKRVAGNHAFALHVQTFAAQLGLLLVYTQPLVARAQMQQLRDELDGRLAAFAASGAGRETVKP